MKCLNNNIKEIEVRVFHVQSSAGVTILYVNLTEHVYEEIVTF